TFNLIFKISGSHAMHTSCDLRLVDHSSLDVLTSEIAARVRRNRGIECQVTGLRTHKNLIAVKFARSDELLKGCVNVALRPLVTVVDRGIEHVDTGSQGARDRLYVSRVCSGVGIAEVRSQTNRREPQLTRTWYVGGAAEVAGIA